MKRKKLRKHAVDFTKFTIIGAVDSLLYIFLIWLSIDILRIPTIISSSVIVGGLFMAKFYSYVLIGLVYSGFRNFMKYASVNIFSALLNIALVWMFIELFSIHSAISAVLVILILFMLRFLVFKKIGLIKK